MIKKFLWALLGIILVVPIAGSIAGVKMLQFQAMGAAAAQMVTPPERVNAAEVQEDLWQPRISAVGSVVAVQGTEVSTEADGVVREIKFKPGANVNAGDELIQLDVDVEKAQLRAAEAAAELAVLSFRRSKELIGARNISQQEHDSAQGTMKQAVAQVDNLRAVIAKKTVRAPFAGRLGIRRISVGQYLDKGKPVVSLQTLDPIHVEFSLPQQKLADLAEGLTVAVTADSYPEQAFEGKITAINPDIDPKTRSVRVQATLANADGRLRPGMFVGVEAVLSRSEKVLFIPATAVQYAPFGDSVFVIEDSTGTAVAAGATESSATLASVESATAILASAGPTTTTVAAADPTTTTLSVRQQFVRLGERQGDYVIVTQGLKAGDTIVSTGVFKLRPQMPVVIDNSLAPTFSLNPKPGNT